MSRLERWPSTGRLVRNLVVAAVLTPLWALAAESLVIHAGGAGSIRYPTAERSHAPAGERGSTSADQRRASGSGTRETGEAGERRSGAADSRRSSDAAQRFGSIRLDSQ
jgi:hypothetical protein